MGGWLDHIGCVWKLDNGVGVPAGVAAEENAAMKTEQRTGYNLIITKPLKDEE
tara:strand:+ start:330 stop:488 length:159 start_codon:yes stop_codon:yes gene_type:complete